MPTIVSASVDLNSEGLGRQTSLARSNRLTVGKNVKKSPSRLQRISKQLKLSGKFIWKNSIMFLKKKSFRYAYSGQLWEIKLNYLNSRWIWSNWILLWYRPPSSHTIQDAFKNDERTRWSREYRMYVNYWFSIAILCFYARYLTFSHNL